MKFLIRSGANISARNISGKTPFEVASHPDNKCRNPRLEETIAFLLKNNQERENNIAISSDDEDIVDEIEEDNNDIAKFLGFSLNNSPLPNSSSIRTASTTPDMKKALVNKASIDNSNKKSNNPINAKTNESTSKARLTYGMEDSKNLSSSTSAASATTSSSITTTATTGAPIAAPANKPTKDDVYEFKSTSKEATPVSSRSSTSPEPNKDKNNPGDKNSSSMSCDKNNPIQASKDGAPSKDDSKGDTVKRPYASTSPDDNNTAEEVKKKKKKEEQPLKSGGRGSRGNSMEKTVAPSKGAKGSKNDRKSPLGDNSATNSPMKKDSSKDETGDNSDEDNSKKVPPLKIVLSNNGGNNTPPSGGNNDRPTESDSKQNLSNNDSKKSCNPSSSRYVKEGEIGTNDEDVKPDSDSADLKDENPSDKQGGGPSGSRMTRSKANQGGTPGPGDSNSFNDNSQMSSDHHQQSIESNDRYGGSNEYQFKKRKLRSQVDDSNKNGGNSGTGNNSNSNNGNGEPLNDIEKYLNIRKQVEQRRKNLFPVQPKPPQGFKDYLMNRKTYLLQENASERMRQIPLIQPPPSLDGPMRELFKNQENARYNLRMKHVVEKEKLVLSVEQVITFLLIMY